MSIYEFLKKYKILVIVLVAIPIITIAAFASMEYCVHKIDMSAGEWSNFIGAILGYIGTAFLGILAFWQNERANETNRRLLDLQKDQSYSFAILKKFLKIEKTINDDCTITHSSQHKSDFGALIVYEGDIAQGTDHLNQYLFELHFEDLSRSLLGLYGLAKMVKNLHHS